MIKTVPALALALLIAAHSSAAPAPAARLVAAEVVFKPPHGDPLDLATRLNSAAFVGGVARSQAATLDRLAGKGDHAAWLSSRLRVRADVKAGTVTMRLDGCPKVEALAILTAVVEAYKANPPAQRRAQIAEQFALAQRLVMVNQVANVAPQPGVQAQFLIAVSDLETVRYPSPAQDDASCGVVQRPRVVPRWQASETAVSR